MSIPMILLMIFVMASVTYLIRMIPFAFIRKKIKSQYLRSLFFYSKYIIFRLVGMIID